MAVKIKERIGSAPYHPRFDFESSGATNDEQTATIKELLIELNDPNAYRSTADYDLKSLRTVLRFAASILGVGKPTSVNQSLPISAIKTIKLLFKSTQFIDAQQVRAMEMPGDRSLATLDFFTSPSSREGEDVKRQIKRMIDAMRTGIDASERSLIDEVCDPARLRETFRQDTNEAIDQILLRHIHIDDDLMEKADAYLAGQTQNFLASISPLKRETRWHVATYTYLKLLDYLHRLHFEISTQLTVPNDAGVSNTRIDATPICKKLSDSRHSPVDIETNFMSIGDVSAFTDEHQSDVARLVSSATGFKYNKRDVAYDRTRALIALQLYLSASGLPNDHNPQPIGVLHVLAAYCSVLHQRKLKSKLSKGSKKYGTRSAQKHLDAFIADPSNHIPYTVQFIYTERTKWYVHALLGRKHKADSHIALQIAQSVLTKDVFLSLDHVRIRRNISDYRAFMMKAASDFIAMHNRQDTVYEWRHRD